MTKFQTWLNTQHRPTLAKKLNVTTALTYYWSSKKATPSLETAIKIVKISEGALDYKDLICKKHVPKQVKEIESATV